MGILLAGPWLQGWDEGRKGSEHLSDFPPQWQLGKLEGPRIRASFPNVGQSWLHSGEGA